MFRYAVFAALLAIATCNEPRRHRVKDPFAALEHQFTHTLAYHYLWPWNQLVKVAAALDAEDFLQEPQIISDVNKFEINMNVKRFKPDELRIKVKDRYIIVEGNHKETSDDTRLWGNHFMQRFALPLGSKQEEVAAILNANGVLSISAPKHPLPPPLPEREVPIVVLLPEKEKPAKVPEVTPEKVPEPTPESVPEPTPEKVPESTPEKTEISIENKEPATTGTPLEQLELTEATTHIGKIRKKELKNTTKTSKDNEVTKGGEGNGLDYGLIETEE